MEDAVIRPYKREDRDRIREIAWQTAFMGEPCDIFFDTKEFLSDFLTLYHTDYEPQSAFVAEYQGHIVGYLTGARDVRVLRRVFRWKILGRLCLRAILGGVLLKRKNVLFLFSCFKSFLKGEFRVPDYSREYPATLHINLKSDFRRTGIGAKLMAAYLSYLAYQGIRGVHFCTISEAGYSFFRNQGFSVLHESKRSYFRHILHNDISAYIVGKKLEKLT